MRRVFAEEGIGGEKQDGGECIYCKHNRAAQCKSLARKEHKENEDGHNAQSTKKNELESGAIAPGRETRTLSISELLMLCAILTTNPTGEPEQPGLIHAPYPDRGQARDGYNDTPDVNGEKQTGAYGNSDYEANPAWNPDLDRRPRVRRRLRKERDWSRDGIP